MKDWIVRVSVFHGYVFAQFGLSRVTFSDRKLRGHVICLGYWILWSDGTGFGFTLSQSVTERAGIYEPAIGDGK